jgi:hypothetical protein
VEGAGQVSKVEWLCNRVWEITRALVDGVIVYADKRVNIAGLLDESEAEQFELGTLQIRGFAL